VEKAGEDLGVYSETFMPNGLEDQKRLLEDLVIKGFDGIAVSPIDPDNQTSLLNDIGKQTKLITHDSDAPQADRLCYVGMDNYAAGLMCGELVKEALPDGGSIMILVGRLEQDNARRRRQGMIDSVLGRTPDPSRYDPPGPALEGNGYKILGTLTDQFDRSRAKANAEDTLAKYPDIACMVGLFAYNPPAIIEALKTANKLGQVQVVAFVEDEATLRGVQDGHVYGTVVQNPYLYGYKSVEVLKDIINGNTGVIPENGFIDIPARKILKDNVDVFWADLKEKVGEDFLGAP
jgi:ribose transport system substrate-binding protein